MALASQKYRKPAITMMRSDHERLTGLAESFAARNADLAEEFLAELDRAKVVADAQLRPGIVRMGSRLRFTTDAGDDRTVTLVYPGEADIEAGKISILTPIGFALIGLSSGQAIDWKARDGRVHRLTVESVDAPDVVTTPEPPEELRPA